MSKIQYTDDEFINAVRDSLSIAESLRKLNLRPSGGNYKSFHCKVDSLNLDTSHFTGAAWNKGLRYKPFGRRVKLEDILVEKSTYKSSYSLKNTLFKNNLTSKKCECCGLTEWNGNPIPLELHHTNGVNTDNRIENLEVMCPNCHAGTENYRGKKCKAGSALAEMRDVEYRKVKELGHGNADENLEPIPTEVGECAENRHGKPKSKICPNCKTLFFGRNKYCSEECYNAIRKNNRPNVFELLEKFKELKTFVKVGEYYNVSDNAVKKWCTTYGILDRVKDYSRPQP